MKDKLRFFGRSSLPRVIPARWWRWEDVLLLLLLAGVLYLPGLGRIPLFDRDEPRFAVAAREMMTRHNFVVPYFNGVLRPDKPPVIYWLMDISYTLFGIHTLAARLPSALCAALTLLVVYGLAGRRFGRATGVLAALMLSVSALYFAEARLATADATMLLFTTVAMAGAWKAWDGGAPVYAVASLPGHARAASPRQPAAPTAGAAPISSWGVWIFWLAIAAGILTKGVTPLFVFSTMITLSLATGAWREAWRQWRARTPLRRLATLPDLLWRMIRRGNWRWWRALHPEWGFPLLLALLAPWFVAAWWQTHGRLIELMLRQNLLQRTTSGLQHHGEPPGFYLGVIWGIFWPWSVLLVPAGYHAIRRMRGRDGLVVDPAPYRFLLAWIIPAWIIFELIVTKMVQYVLPLFIPLIILCADTLIQSFNHLTDVLAAGWFGVARWVWLGVWLVLAGLLAGGAWWCFGRQQPATFFVIAPTAAALAAVGIAGAVCWNRSAWPYATVLTFGLALLIADTVTLPHIPALQLNRRAAAAMRPWMKKGFQPAAAGYIEPSLVFYCGRRIDLFSDGPALLGTVPFSTKPPSSRRSVPPPTGAAPAAGVPAAVLIPHHRVRATPGGEHRPALARAGSAPSTVPRFCVLVDPSVLRYLRRHHIRYFTHGYFTGWQLAKARPARLTLLTNVHP